MVDGVDRTGDIDLNLSTIQARDSHNQPRIVRFVLNGAAIPVGAAIEFRASVLLPDLMDWTDFLIAANPPTPDGPTQQQNLDGEQFGVTDAAGTPQLHRNEIRIRTDR